MFDWGGRQHMRKTWIVALVAIFTALLGGVSASAADVSPLACSSSHVSARLERLDCGPSYIGRVRVTVTRSIGMTGHWEFRVNNRHIRNEPTSSDVWLGPNVGRVTTVEYFARSGDRFCAALWEYTGSGYAQRGQPCVTI